MVNKPTIVDRFIFHILYITHLVPIIIQKKNFEKKNFEMCEGWGV